MSPWTSSSRALRNRRLPCQSQRSRKDEFQNSTHSVAAAHCASSPPPFALTSNGEGQRTSNLFGSLNVAQFTGNMKVRVGRQRVRFGQSKNSKSDERRNEVPRSRSKKPISLARRRSGAGPIVRRSRSSSLPWRRSFQPFSVPDILRRRVSFR